MKLKGRLRDWQDDKGFGFIEPMQPGPSVFVHVKSFIRPTRRPRVGDLLIYELGQGRNGRPRAERVDFSLASKPPIPQRPKSQQRPWAIPLSLIAIGGLAAAWTVGAIPTLILGLYAGASLIAYVLYAWDKVSAQNDRWRTKESTLLIAGLLGGWPGALIAQETMRHKTAKTSFQGAFWLSVLVNIAAISWGYVTDFEILNAVVS